MSTGARPGEVADASVVLAVVVVAGARFAIRGGPRTTLELSVAVAVVVVITSMLVVASGTEEVTEGVAGKFSSGGAGDVVDDSLTEEVVSVGGGADVAVAVGGSITTEDVSADVFTVPVSSANAREINIGKNLDGKNDDALVVAATGERDEMDEVAGTSPICHTSVMPTLVMFPDVAKSVGKNPPQKI